MNVNLPTGRTLSSVYSNFDHVLNHEVVAELIAAEPGTLCAQHSAWNFCAYVWREGDQWVEQIWCHHVPIETRRSTNLEDLIASINDDYGHD